jgi:hypothetical protein
LVAETLVTDQAPPLFPATGGLRDFPQLPQAFRQSGPKTRKQDGAGALAGDREFLRTV